MSKKIFHTQMQQISSINFISHLYIQLMFIELQVTRNKTMNKMQLHFSKSPQSRRGKYLLESICVFMQKQEPPLLIPAWLLKNYFPYNPCRSSWIHVCIYHHLNKVMTCNCKCTQDNKNTVSSHCSLVPTCLPWREAAPNSPSKLGLWPLRCGQKRKKKLRKHFPLYPTSSPGWYTPVFVHLQVSDQLSLSSENLLWS